MGKMNYLGTVEEEGAEVSLVADSGYYYIYSVPSRNFSFQFSEFNFDVNLK